MTRTLACLFLTGLFTLAAGAADTPVSFADPVQRARYDTLLEELRCLVCQNQSLADSHADLAQDLRDEVYRMVTAGNDDREIREFMVARYGDFVLYKPPVKATTWLLWFGPLLLLVFGLAVVLITTRSRQAARVELSDTEKARARAILDEQD